MEKEPNRKVIEISEVTNGYIAHLYIVDGLTKQPVENRHFVFQFKDDLKAWFNANI